MRPGSSVVYVAMGGNLGDREATFSKAIEALEVEPELRVEGASSVYETPPLGPDGQAPYLNAVIRAESGLAPIELLDCLQSIENRLGRDRGPDSVRWGPRVIDLDLLFYADRCIEEPRLIVPHAAAHERAFVMIPMAEIAGELAHPRLGLTMSEILAGLPAPDREAVRLQSAPPGWPQRG